VPGASVRMGEGKVHPDLKYKVGRQPLTTQAPVQEPAPGTGVSHNAENDVVKKVSAPFWFSSPRATINPTSDAMANWDKTIMGVLLYTALVTPFEVSFLTPSWGVMFYINRCVDTIFVVDIVFTFLLDPGNDETKKSDGLPSHSKIAKAYLTGWFAVDVISCTPFDAFSIMMEGTAVEDIKFLRTLRLFRLVKLVRLLRATRMFDRWEDSLAINFAALSLTKSCTMVFMFSHWFACLWYITAYIEDAPTNWLTAGGFQDYNTFEFYIASWYFSVMTMSTIGYGDISPVTSIERVVACIMMLVGAGIYAYVVGSITTTVQSMEAATRKYQELMDQLNQFLDENNVQQDLRVQARKYFRTRSQAGNLVDWRELLNELSPDLREQIAAMSHSNWVGDSSYFWKCDEEFIGKAAALFTEVTYPRGERIIEIGQPVDCLYVIKKGVVWSKGRVVCKGGLFGEDVALDGYNPERRSPYVAMALTFVQLQALNWEELYALLEEFPRVKEQTRRASLRRLFKEHIYAYASAFRMPEKPLGLLPNLQLIEHYGWKIKWLRMTGKGSARFFKAIIKIQSVFRGYEGRKIAQGKKDSLLVQLDRRLSRQLQSTTQSLTKLIAGSDPQGPKLLLQLLASMELIHHRLDSIDKHVGVNSNSGQGDSTPVHINPPIKPPPLPAIQRKE